MAVLTATTESLIFNSPDISYEPEKIDWKKLELQNGLFLLGYSGYFWFYNGRNHLFMLLDSWDSFLFASTVVVSSVWFDFLFLHTGQINDLLLSVIVFTVVSHSCPFTHFHRIFCFAPVVILSGVRSPFLLGCQWSAIFGKWSWRLPFFFKRLSRTFSALIALIHSGHCEPLAFEATDCC